MAEGKGFEPLCGVTRKLISSQPRYDHFDNPPYACIFQLAYHSIFLPAVQSKIGGMCMVFLFGTGEFANYRAALDKIGRQALISQDIAKAASCRGLLLPGGGDIHGELEEPERDLIRFFVENQRPILGICRGMQALNVCFGGTLYDFVPGHQTPGDDMRHLTHATGLIATLMGADPIVNSNHHQAVKTPGSALIVCQWAQDGIVEAIQHRSLPILGVQWHPERWKSGEKIFGWFAAELKK